MWNGYTNQIVKYEKHVPTIWLNKTTILHFFFSLLLLIYILLTDFEEKSVHENI